MIHKHLVGQPKKRGNFEKNTKKVSMADSYRTLIGTPKQHFMKNMNYVSPFYAFFRSSFISLSGPKILFSTLLFPYNERLSITRM
jgi:hypothetical protein